MNLVSPAKVLDQVNAAIPVEYRNNVIIIGSLAAGYYFFGDDDSRAVRTKDIDCVLSPRIAAVQAGEVTAQTLLDSGWTRRSEGGWDKPGTAETPSRDLSAVRLFPPGSHEWFLELLAVPESEQSEAKTWTRIKLDDGYFALPSYRFLPLATFDPIVVAKLGIYCARPVMMALNNLLSHPFIGPEVMSSQIANRTIKRSNKDLGRVLAIARLSPDDELETWPDRWERALRHEFPTTWKQHAGSVGDGLRALLRSPNDLEEAHHTCINGLLASIGGVTMENLAFIGQRVLADAIEPLEKLSVAVDPLEKVAE
jgi:hypothetical protein